MKNILINTATSWVIIYIAFFLGTGLLYNPSDWDDYAKVPFTFLLLVSWGAIVIFETLNPDKQ